MPEEHTEQSWWKWRSRERRERQKFSVSVGEALVDPAQSEEDEPKQSATLIPPLLSLQSRPLPAVRSGSFVESATRARMMAVRADAEREGQGTTAPAQTTGKLARFAQRLTSSLAVFGATMHYDNFPLLPPPLSDEPQRLSRQQEGSLLPPTLDMMTPGIALDLQDTAPAGMPQVPISPPSSLEPSAPKKIRLETAVMPAIPRPAPIEVPEKSYVLERSSEKREGRVSETSSRLPVVESSTTNAGRVSTHSPATDAQHQAKPRDRRTMLFGSGGFEGGQSDVSVANQEITRNSVVLVTLTTNPGPVVVQYVSLQPGSGFTVHLTAPTTVRTAFNYVIF